MFYSNFLFFQKLKTDMDFISLALWLWCFTETLSQTVTLRYDIQENKAPGTFVGNVPYDAKLREKHGDTIYRTLRYRFLKEPKLVKNLFIIQSNNGDIKVARNIDREALCNGNSECKFDCHVVVTPREYFQKIKVTISILDVNDHVPTFPVESLKFEIVETAAPGTTVASIPNPEDGDSGVYGVQNCILTGPVKSKFSLSLVGQDYRTGELFLVVSERLDREQKDTYQGSIKAVDGGYPQKTGEIPLTVKVIDFNDNIPVFHKSSYEFSVSENVRIPALIGQIGANDDDDGFNSEIRYRFGDQTDADYGRIFRIDSQDGRIIAKAALDYEAQQVYYLSVIAADRGQNPHSAETTVVVQLKDYNDNAPEVRISTISNTDQAAVSESSDMGTFVAHLTVNDKDDKVNGEFTCTMDSKSFTLAQYSTKEYQIVTKTYLDRENISFYNLTVVCRDKGTPQRSSTHTVGVKILDINDNEPVFTTSHYNFTVIENNHIGKVIGRVTAIDPDYGPNSKLSYSLTSSASLFSIGRSTGIITAEYNFNFEHYQKINFNVTAVDGGTPRHSATALVSVYVRDTNDKKPIFSEPYYEFEVYENEPFWTYVGQVHALDSDSNLYNNISYMLVPSPEARNLFAISLDKGTIHTRKSLDREETAVYHLSIMASNRGYSGMSSSVPVTVLVKDRNDHTPRFLFPTEENHTVQISPQLPVGYSMAKITARDPDSGLNGAVTYDCINKLPQFSLHSDTGTLSVATNLAKYVDKRYELTVTASDNGKPPRTSKMLLEIIVNASAPLPAALKGGPQGANFVIIVSLSTVCGISILVLLIAIIFTWHKRRNRWYKAQPTRERTEQSTVLSQNFSSDSHSSGSPSHNILMHQKYSEHGDTLQFKHNIFPVVPEETDDGSYLPPPPPEMQGEVIEISSPKRCMSPYHPDHEQVSLLESQ